MVKFVLDSLTLLDRVYVRACVDISLHFFFIHFQTILKAPWMHECILLCLVTILSQIAALHGQG